MLLLGIVYHVQFMLGLRHLRQSMRDEGTIYGETVFPVSLTLITAFLLLAVGVAAFLSMEFQVGPFGWREGGSSAKNLATEQPGSQAGIFLFRNRSR
jgi:hypothetical protein